MVDCIEILKDILKIIAKEKPELLNRWVALRTYVYQVYGTRIPPKCKRGMYLRKALEEFRKNSREWIEITVPVPITREVKTPGASGYPEYTIAEAIYVGLYQEDPVNAHNKMYQLLEPVLLSPYLEHRNIKRALFIPATDKTWKRLMEYLVKFLELLDDERRKTVCRCLEKTMFLLFLGLPRVVSDNRTYYIRVHIPRKLFALCNNLQRIGGG